MGFFSSKVTYVSSSVYNLAGDVDTRPQFLRSLVLGAAFRNDNGATVGETVRAGYIRGPAMKLRSYFRWAEEHYQEVGVPQGSLGSVINVNADVVASQIMPLAGHKVNIQYVRVEAFTYSYWAEQYVFEHHPDRINTEWTADMDAGAGSIMITYADGTKQSFIPVVDQNAMYIYAIYSQVNKTTNAWLTPKMFIYKIGAGNAALDDIVSRTRDMGEYVPYIPVRLDNKWVKDVNPAAAVLAEKAYKKATGGKIEDLITQLEDNESLNEIDYAYVMFGVPLNVKERASREYLFRFFDKCRLRQGRSEGDFNAWSSVNTQFEDKVKGWESWMGSLVSSAVTKATPGAVSRGEQPMAIGNEIKITSAGSLNVNINMTISWQSITETHGSGLKRTGAKKGDVWITYGAYSENDSTLPLLITAGAAVAAIFGKVSSKNSKVPIYIHWQVTANTWRTLAIVGLEHKNLIYKKKAVEISAVEALVDTEESGFLVPLHYATLREMSLVDQTQMLTAGAYLVLNSYKVVKKKWYQTWWFSVILFVAIVVITVVTAGAGTAPALAAASSIAAAAGLTGVVALVVAAIINTLAVMIVSKILMAASIAVFGAKWGALIGTILTIAVTFGANAAAAGQSFASATHSLASAASLIQLTSALGNGIAGVIRGETMQTVGKTQDIVKKSELDLARVQELYDQNIGNSGITLDPMGLTSGRFDPYAFVQKFEQFIPESRDTFLTRTLLTGTDIAEMTMDIIGNFVSYSIKVDLPH